MKSRSRYLIVYLALSFFIPFIIMGTVFAFRRVYPFGDRQILYLDLYVQHYPFFSNFWHKLREGSVSSWSWIAAAGHNYMPVIAYFLASPLNVFTFLLPHAWLREAMTLILLIKIGCAGLSTAMFLSYTVKKSNLALPFFSSLYALCAYTLGYYWAIPNFDGFALLPLVAMGFLALMNEGKWRLYAASLALAVFANFYMGFFVCIFVALTFLSQCVIQKYKLREFLSKLGLTAACTALALGLAAVLFIPAFSALRSISIPGNTFPAKAFLYTSFFDILGNFIAFTPPTSLNGLPNLYCGMISIMLAGLFISSPKICLREKVVLAGTLIFLIVSCNLNVLDYIMHGFHFTRNVPSRFSFLISFMLVVIAYRAFSIEEKITGREILVMGISAAVFLLAAVFGPQRNTHIIGSTVLCLVYLSLFYCYGRIKLKIVRQIFLLIISLVIFTELFISSRLGVMAYDVTEVDVTDRDAYPPHYNDIQALLDLRQPAEKKFSRTEMIPYFTSNDPNLYNYNGISFFSSTVNVEFFRFMEEGLGLNVQPGSSSRLAYVETTPLTNAFLNIRHIISHESHLTGLYRRPFGKAGEYIICENLRYLPLGFMVSEDLAGYTHHEGNAFVSQNELFNLATGMEGDLFTITKLTGDTPPEADADNSPVALQWDYRISSDGMLYVYCIPGRYDEVVVSVNDRFFRDIHFPGSYIAELGNFRKDDIITFTAESSATIYAGYLDSALFDQGYVRFASQPLVLTEFTNTKVSGHVTALDDGLLYTSIPADRNWSVYVDGVKNDIVLIDNAIAAVRLSRGAHFIEFRYFDRSLLAGIIISLVSLAVFLLCSLFPEYPKLMKKKIGRHSNN